MSVTLSFFFSLKLLNNRIAISHFRNEFGNGTSWGPQKCLGSLLGTDMFWGAAFQAYWCQITMSKSDLLLTEKNIPGAKLLRRIEECNCTILLHRLLFRGERNSKLPKLRQICVVYFLYTSFSVEFFDAFRTYKYVFYWPYLLNMFCLFSFTECPII